MNILKRIMELPLGPAVWMCLVLLLPLMLIRFLFNIEPSGESTLVAMVILYLVKFAYNIDMVRRDAD